MILVRSIDQYYRYINIVIDMKSLQDIVIDNDTLFSEKIKDRVFQNRLRKELPEMILTRESIMDVIEKTGYSYLYTYDDMEYTRYTNIDEMIEEISYTLGSDIMEQILDTKSYNLFVDKLSEYYLTTDKTTDKIATALGLECVYVYSI